MVVRLVAAVALALAGWQAGSLIGHGASQPRNALIGIGAGAIVGFVVAPWLFGAPYDRLRRAVSSLPVGDLLTGASGLIIGLIVAALFSFPLSFLPWYLGHVLPAIAAIVFGYLGVTLATMRRRDMTRLWQRQVTEEAAAHPNGASILVDTSAIIDGRIADVSQTGFLHGTLVIPKFVLSELQHIADSADPLRRNRGRRGLDILNRLQKDGESAIEIADIDARDVPDVDGKLVKLAQKMGSPVVTNDFNLNRVAELQGVKVLNINQLANALKTVVLPGEEMTVHLVQEGKEFDQGVAYLDDGTMIVVEHGKPWLNKDLEVTVTRVLQTVAGRMIFAQPKAAGRA
ncbi:MAG: PIN/TRAM domain-containing protein [Chloroflexota bacterium]